MKTLKLKIRKLTKENHKILTDFCHYSNNLYNYANYIIRQYYFNTNKYIGLNELTKECMMNENYKLLPSQSAQQIIRLLDKNYRSFFALLRKKKLGQYNDKISIPHYKPKNGMFNLIYTYQTLRLFNKYLMINTSDSYNKLNNRKGRIKIPFTHKMDGKIKQIIIKPYKNKSFEMYIQYEKENRKEKQYDLDKNKYLSIDLGLNNLMTCTTNMHDYPFIINGKPLKSYNQWYNKNKSNYISILKKVNNKYWSKRLENLEINRKWFIDNYFNQAVNKIIKYCIQNNIGNIIQGYNKTWKSEINIGKINNRQFVSIPYYLLLRKLQNKCDEYNINYILTDESYTSKCSFIDKEPLEHSDNYLGKRIKRGLFKSKYGIKLNSDVNGSFNIMRKVIGDVIYNDQSIMNLMFNPIKINIF